MHVRAAQIEDLEMLDQCDAHIQKEELAQSILRNRIYIAEKDTKFIGWLRYNLFWDNTPFMNMLYLFA